jgi:hypothetical protein
MGRQWQTAGTRNLLSHALNKQADYPCCREIASLLFVGLLLSEKMPKDERGLHLYSAGNPVERQGGEEQGIANRE